jgi:hypothetical protein
LSFADTLPVEILRNPIVHGLLEKWHGLKDESVFAVLRAGAAQIGSPANSASSKREFSAWPYFVGPKQ